MQSASNRKNPSALVLSIKPEYVERIIAGTKKYEYRRRLAKREIDVIYIYCTAPTSRVVAAVKVIGRISEPPSELWDETKRESGISHEKYNEYFTGCKIASAYVLGDVTHFEEPLPISRLGIASAPQSFAYVQSAV